MYFQTIVTLNALAFYSLKPNSYVKYFFNLKFDLEWVLENWESEGCDLWEEVRSADFYFNRMAYVYSLNIAADFGDMIGQPGGDQYRQLAERVKVKNRSFCYTNCLTERAKKQKLRHVS